MDPDVSRHKIISTPDVFVSEETLYFCGLAKAMTMNTSDKILNINDSLTITTDAWPVRYLSRDACEKDIAEGFFLNAKMPQKIIIKSRKSSSGYANLYNLIPF
jgi:hypothetical protein